MMANTSSIRFKYASPDRYGILKVFAHENRAKATLAENILCDRVRNKKLGVEIRRQHIIYDYIADFVCLDKMLVIEVDGAYHAEISQQEDDAARTENLNSIGFTVIRFTNEDVIYSTLANVPGRHYSLYEAVSNRVRSARIEKRSTVCAWRALP